MPNWEQPANYQFIASLRPELLAWQFLCRNPEYQQDYRWFITTWRALEHDYGRAPNRDFSAWKIDPRAYRVEREIYGLNENASTVCDTPDSNLLIECWMGLKWGFYKFPIDPNNQQPIYGRDLNWRTEATTVKLYESQLFADIKNQALENNVAIVFNLDKNLKDQIQSAKQQLLITQRKYLQHKPNSERYILYCRLLDALHDNIPEPEIQSQLKLNQHDYLQFKNNALELQRDNYLDIINSL